MRHRKRGRVLGRSPSHRKALLKNLTKSLILTEDPLLEELGAAGLANPPKVKGRIKTTLHKAKEVRPLVEKCITIARKGLQAEEKAAEYATDAERGSKEWQEWRTSERWQNWSKAMAPAVNARRRIAAMLSERGDPDSPGDKRVLRVLFEELAPRFADRPGGYTRILKLADRRLGDAGAQAILEFVGKHDRVELQAPAPAFDTEEEEAIAESPVEEPTTQTAEAESPTEEQASTEQTSTEQASEEKPAEEQAEGETAEEAKDETQAEKSDDEKKE